MRSAQRDAEAEQLFANCLNDYTDGGVVEKQEVSRKVASAFGGLRLAVTGGLLTGQGADNTPNRRLKLGSTWRTDAASWPPKALTVRELAALKKLPPAALAVAVEISLRGIHSILVQRRRPLGWRLNKLRAFAARIPSSVRQKNVDLDTLPEIKAALLTLSSERRDR